LFKIQQRNMYYSSCQGSFVAIGSMFKDVLHCILETLARKHLYHPILCFRSRYRFQIASDIYSSRYRLTHLVVYLIVLPLWCQYCRYCFWLFYHCDVSTVDIVWPKYLIMSSLPLWRHNIVMMSQCKCTAASL
jgi:hypothetical protein